MIKSIVVVGGGAAGWITAGLIAARFSGSQTSPISVTLIESPNIPIIGVGEGTWPTMLDTLKKLGIPEHEFLQRCDATFKQASKFQRWVTGQDNDVYYHPFSMPQGFEGISLASRWQEKHPHVPFAEAVGLQAELCNRRLAPKHAKLGEYSFVENHGYHLDAGKFATLLKEHCTSKLGVRHILADVCGINTTDNGDIASLPTRQGVTIDGDLFIDCTGSASLLIGKHYKIPFVSKKDVLFIDRALAVQVPYNHENADIESATISTAQSAGWIWDIGLPSRRGVGHVFSSTHISTDEAKEQLKAYLKPDVKDLENLSVRELSFDPGHRERFWVNNCVAVGMSAGFLEPLEASALVMVELAAKTISLHLPASREAMDVVAKHYNEVFLFRWNRVIDFLKLHYVLSKRTDSAFWRDNHEENTIPDSLRDLLTLWRHQPPSNNGFLSPYDLFPAASYQYILYGMGFRTEPCHLEGTPEQIALADAELRKVQARKAKIPQLLPTNRALLQTICRLDSDAELNLAKTRSSSCVPVSLSDVTGLASHLPVFFMRSPDTRQLTSTVLLGLARDENLMKELGDVKPLPDADKIPNHAAVFILEELGLLEPVKLDIAFNDKSTTMISGLMTINQKKLTQLSLPQRQELERYGLRPIIQAALMSLKHVSTLIERKNQQRASAA